jgi:hypothetical protein
MKPRCQHHDTSWCDLQRLLLSPVLLWVFHLASTKVREEELCKASAQEDDVKIRPLVDTNTTATNTDKQAWLVVVPLTPIIWKMKSSCIWIPAPLVEGKCSQISSAVTAWQKVACYPCNFSPKREIFSLAGRVVSKEKNRTGDDEKVSKMIFVNYNILTKTKKSRMSTSNVEKQQRNQRSWSWKWMMIVVTAVKTMIEEEKKTVCILRFEKEQNACWRTKKSSKWNDQCFKSVCKREAQAKQRLTKKTCESLKHNSECPTLMLWWLLMRQACGVKSPVFTHQNPRQRPQTSDHYPRQTKGNIYGGFSLGSWGET